MPLAFIKLKTLLQRTQESPTLQLASHTNLAPDIKCQLLCLLNLFQLHCSDT